MKKILLGIVGLLLCSNVLFANESRYMVLGAVKSKTAAENFLKILNSKIGKHKYFDFADISHNKSFYYIYMRTKAMDKKEFIPFLKEVRKLARVNSAYYCSKKGCGFDVKDNTPREVKDIKTTTVNMTLDQIVEKLSQEEKK